MIILHPPQVFPETEADALFEEVFAQASVGRTKVLFPLNWLVR